MWNELFLNMKFPFFEILTEEIGYSAFVLSGEYARFNQLIIKKNAL